MALILHRHETLFKKGLKLICRDHLHIGLLIRCLHMMAEGLRYRHHCLLEIVLNLLQHRMQLILVLCISLLLEALYQLRMPLRRLLHQLLHLGFYRLFFFRHPFAACVWHVLHLSQQSKSPGDLFLFIFEQNIYALHLFSISANQGQQGLLFIGLL